MKLQKGSCWQCSVVDSWSELNEKIYWLIDEWTEHHGVIKGDAFMLKGIWTVVAQVRKKVNKLHSLNWTNKKTDTLLTFFLLPTSSINDPCYRKPTELSEESREGRTVVCMERKGTWLAAAGNCIFHDCILCLYLMCRYRGCGGREYAQRHNKMEKKSRDFLLKVHSLSLFLV